MTRSTAITWLKHPAGFAGLSASLLGAAVCLCLAGCATSRPAPTAPASAGYNTGLKLPGPDNTNR